MIPVPPGVRVLIATRPVDFRKGADSLAALAKETLAQDPFSGAVLVFRSRRADRIKILIWDGSGLLLVWKRLEQGAFKWPPITNGVMRLSPAQLAALVEGLDWIFAGGGRKRPSLPRYAGARAADRAAASDTLSPRREPRDKLNRDGRRNAPCAADCGRIRVR